MELTGSPFPTTNWLLVAGLEPADDLARMQALEELCRAYWPALYSFARYRGLGSTDAEDVTQGFIADLLRRESLNDMDPAAGKLRSFLSVSMRHYISNWMLAKRAQRRGGGKDDLELESVDLNGELIDASGDFDPEMVFDRGWVQALLERSKQRLQASYASRGKDEIFRELVVFLVPGEVKGELETVALHLGLSAAAVRTRLSRMREELGAEIRAEVKSTVGRDVDVEEEVRGLMGVFARS